MVKAFPVAMFGLSVFISVVGFITGNVLLSVLFIIITAMLSLGFRVYIEKAEQTIKECIEIRNKSKEIADSTISIDLLTSTCNRTKYKSDLSERKDSRVQAVLYSLSDIHKLNMEIGEDCTDDLLIKSVNIIRNKFSDKRLRIYRTGSAEFMVIINTAMKNEELQRLSQETLNSLSELLMENYNSKWEAFCCKGRFKDNLLTVMKEEAKGHNKICNFKNFQYC